MDTVQNRLQHTHHELVRAASSACVACLSVRAVHTGSGGGSGGSGQVTPGRGASQPRGTCATAAAAQARAGKTRGSLAGSTQRSLCAVQAMAAAASRIDEQEEAATTHKRERMIWRDEQRRLDTEREKLQHALVQARAHAQQERSQLERRIAELEAGAAASEAGAASEKERLQVTCGARTLLHQAQSLLMYGQLELESVREMQRQGQQQVARLQAELQQSQQEQQRLHHTCTNLGAPMQSPRRSRAAHCFAESAVNDATRQHGDSERQITKLRRELAQAGARYAETEQARCADEQQLRQRLNELAEVCPRFQGRCLTEGAHAPCSGCRPLSVLMQPRPSPSHSCGSSTPRWSAN